MMVEIHFILYELENFLYILIAYILGYSGILNNDRADELYNKRHAVIFMSVPKSY